MAPVPTAPASVASAPTLPAPTVSVAPPDEAVEPAVEPPPVPSARFPDVRPPVDQDWVLDRPRPTPVSHDEDLVEDPDQAARIQDLLAPFEEVRPRRPTPTTPPRLPDYAPTVAGERHTAAPSADEDAARTRREVSGKSAPPLPPQLPARAPDAPSADDGTHIQGDTLPPPPSSARLPDAPPLVLGKARTDAAPGVSVPRTQGGAAGETAPPPPSSARLPDVPPVVGEARTRAALDEGVGPAVGGGVPRTQGDASGETVLSSARLADESPVVVGKVGTADADVDEAFGAGGRGGAVRTRRDGFGGEMEPRSSASPGRAAQEPSGGGGAEGRPFVFLARPAMGDDRATRPRTVGAWARPRAAAAAACAVLGLGLIGGAVTGSWLTGESAAGGAARSAYTVTGALWHSVPVDRLFPPELKGEGAGPGGADRDWTRIAVAPDSGCQGAFDPLLKKALDPVGCLRLLRATYTDATHSHVTTVGLLFTKADADAMQTLRNRFTEEGLDRRTDLMPRPYAAKGTAAEGFGDAQRAAWTVSVLPDAPVVAYAVSGFADGRAVTDPQPATEAMGSNTTSAPAQAGLGHEAKGIADRVERGLRKTIAAAEKTA
ncbi:hypothetical protein ACH4D5_35400 [Streptomyces sp. NPDC018029]|uniref:hypothetical protein n=1 Tax=Streptomyces sp. NPDC018029 TaxID=3365032 RepID=UPI0037A5AA84